MGVWARNGIDVFVADYGNHRVQRFDRNLAFVSSFSTRNRPNLDDRLPEGRAGFGYPTDIAVSRHGDLFICDGENSRILKVIGLSKIEKTFGGFDAGKGLLHKPSQLEIGPNDNVYVHDGQRVVVFDNFGNFIRVIGEGVFAGTIYISADETGLIVLSDQNLLFFDRDDRLILTVGLHEMNVHSPRAFVFSRGTAYFLTARGISAVADPRRTHSNEKQ
jgi:DNA-binding beta-propeller fold protein YncE